MFNAVRTVMTFAEAPEASARWWGELLDTPVKVDVSDSGAVYAWVEIGGVEVGFHLPTTSATPGAAARSSIGVSTTSTRCGSGCWRPAASITAGR